MIISKTPFRMSFFGGGTDYPEWYLKHGGCVLSSTFDKYCYITCRTLPPFFDHKYRITYSKVEHRKSLDHIEHSAIKAAIQKSRFLDGLEIHCDADLPARTGLGSSSTFIVGLINALAHLQGQKLSPKALAESTIEIEREVLFETVGSQDQYAAAFGGLNLIKFSQTGKISVEPVFVEPKRFQNFQNHFMLFFTGISRSAPVIAKKKVAQFDSKHAELSLMHSNVIEATQILKSSSDIQAFGELMHTNWLIKKSLCNSISNPEIDAAYSEARRAGAIGGKLLGAGGGGFLLMFVSPEKQSSVKVALSNLIHVPFKFENKGAEIIYNGNKELNFQTLGCRGVA